jgi:hypothetical protein
MMATPAEDVRAMALALKNGGVLPLAVIERIVLRDAIDRLGVIQAGKVLGMGKTTVYRRMQAWAMTAPPQGDGGRLPVVYSAEQLSELLHAARIAANYLSHCVGRAREIGEALDRQLCAL